MAEDLGIPCGIVFDPEGRLYVGDRAGKIYRIDAAGKRDEFASLPPSISAYHLAMDGEGCLYVTGPTLAMRDPVYRISRKGEVAVFLDEICPPSRARLQPEWRPFAGGILRRQEGDFPVFLPFEGIGASHCRADAGRAGPGRRGHLSCGWKFSLLDTHGATLRPAQLMPAAKRGRSAFPGLTLKECREREKRNVPFSLFRGAM